MLGWVKRRRTKMLWYCQWFVSLVYFLIVLLKAWEHFKISFHQIVNKFLDFIHFFICNCLIKKVKTLQLPFPLKFCSNAHLAIFVTHWSCKSSLSKLVASIEVLYIHFMCHNYISKIMVNIKSILFAI